MEETDLDLLRRAKAGRHEAFHRLMDRHAPAMLRLGATLVPTHHDAEDLLQETFIAAFRGLASFQERSSVKTWLYAILFRQASLLRRKRGVSPLQLSVDAPSGDPPEAARTEARIDLETALAHLPDDARAILILRELDGLAYEEIASVLQVPRGTVESRLFRARQALRQWLAPHMAP